MKKKMSNMNVLIEIFVIVFHFIWILDSKRWATIQEMTQLAHLFNVSSNNERTEYDEGKDCERMSTDMVSALYYVCVYGMCLCTDLIHDMLLRSYTLSILENDSRIAKHITHI